MSIVRIMYDKNRMGFAVPFLGVLLMCIAAIPSMARTGVNTCLWYDKPARNWNEALPLGNGRIGAMVYGDPYEECIQFNEATFWSGSPHRNDRPEGFAALAEVRKLQFEGRFEDARKLVDKHMLSKNGHGMIFLPVGNLRMQFLGTNDYVSYRRTLDLETGVHTVSYVVDGIKFTRECFVSYPDQVFVIRLTADKPKSINLSLTMDSPQENRLTNEQNKRWLMQLVSADHEGVEGKVRLNVYTQLDVQGGLTLNIGDGVRIKKADEMTVYVTMRSNYENYKDLTALPERAEEDLKCAAETGYAKLKERHKNDFLQYSLRSSLQMPENEFSLLPTDQRLKHYEEDTSLPALLYQWGRYLMISASRQGGQPTTLQGLWNGDIRPEWDSKYTININTQMNYWAAEATNLSELHHPLFEMLQDLSEAGRETARNMYAADGWTAHHNTDLWRTTGMVDGATWGAWPYGGIWLSMHLWYHYLYTGDKAFLATYFPVLEGAARFLLDFLVEEPEHGWLVGAPSISPENSPKRAGKNARMNYGCTLDNQLAFDLFEAVIRASDVLKVKDKSLLAEVRSAMRRLPPLQIGEYGQLQEWMWDWDSDNEYQPHISHLYGFYPSSQISFTRTPLLAAAVRNSLLQRNENGNTSWGNAWRVCQWARMHDGENALKFLRKLMQPATAENGHQGSMANLFSSIYTINNHNYFQIDANFGALAGIVEMLIQSHDGVIDILPALPAVWREGRLTGVRARGGFVVDVEWKDGEVKYLKVTSSLGGVCKIRTAHPLVAGQKLKLCRGKAANSYYEPSLKVRTRVSPKAEIEPVGQVQASTLSFETVEGGVYEFGN